MGDILSFSQGVFTNNAMNNYLTLLFRLIYHIPGPMGVDPMLGLGPEHLPALAQFQARLAQMHQDLQQMFGQGNRNNSMILLKLLELYYRSQLEYILTVMQKQNALKL